DRAASAKDELLDDDDDDEDNQPNTKVVQKAVPANRAAVMKTMRPRVGSLYDNPTNALSLPTGPILVVRHNGRFGAVQALEQSGKFIRYAWWYQPDGSGSFVNEHVLTGEGKADENVHPVMPPLKVGPFEIQWSVGPRGRGWVYYRNYDLQDVVYDLALTDAT